jgi:hypothetical protein
MTDKNLSELITSSYNGPNGSNLIDDTAPELGGDLDVNGNSILYRFNVTNDASGAYSFSDPGNHWFISTENNPVLHLRRGETYVFDVNASGHPFHIKTKRVIGTGDTYDDGVTNNGDDLGEVIFKVPMNAPDTLYYQCSVHSVMGNKIKISSSQESEVYSLESNPP